jgi:hypothetical protein
VTALFILFAILIAWFGAWGVGRQYERPVVDPKEEAVYANNSEGLRL